MARAKPWGYKSPKTPGYKGYLSQKSELTKNM